MEADNETPVLTIYRTNGLMWAAFSLYVDGTEEPSDIFANDDDMLRHAGGALPHRIEYRPQELGCEVSDDERAAVRRLAAAYDAQNQRNRTRLWFRRGHSE